MSAHCVYHFLCLSIFFALFAVTISTKLSLDDVVERLIEVETKLKESEREIGILQETTLLQKEVIENQEIRIQSLETELAGHRDIISAGREKAADTTQEIKDLHDKPRIVFPKRTPQETKLKHQRESSKNRIRPLRHVDRVGVAFTAYLDHDGEYGTQQVIKFNKVITNEGNGYNQYTGVFTCPQAGMYMFTFFIGERSNTDGIKQMWADLVVNGNFKLTAIAETKHATEDAQGGNSAVLRLQQGDSVWIESKGANHIEGDARSTSFTGLYLYQ
ncbi:uncharacterized protein LOC123555672 isoform X2 [Mercenaria mercenaria]|uniref:uncharacterized protein LOC123555672 isoform X2 n=1 Tax=Mercenaria mercenaria TaxID=6596 RepID=UPI00234F6AEB|nr:uncharacterized protein LOC123555672 isoform X2 [Mercenaria mercenaria]